MSPEASSAVGLEKSTSVTVHRRDRAVPAADLGGPNRKKVTATKSGGTFDGCAAAQTFVVKNLDSASFVEE